MHCTPSPTLPAGFRPLALAIITLFGISACGGGNGAATSGSNNGVGLAPASTTAGGGASVTLPSGLVAQPSYHMAAVTPPPPSTIDEGGTNASARQPPVTVPLSVAAASIDTARLTPESLAAQLQAQAQVPAGTASIGVSPDAHGAGAPVRVVRPQSTSVYTPAQIRAAYGLPPLPAAGTSLSASQAAALGAGQTIYIVDANDNPNAFPDLNTFSTTFGLPTCTKLVVTPSTALPLAAPGSGCQLVIAYANSSGGANASAPPYDSGWAPEIALDVQWSHAIAPLARIVLLEGASASLNDLLGGVLLANQMGPGVLSMSFGAGEGSWVTSTDSVFTTTGMTYLASSGDSGAGVNWPAVSSNVLAVGGTSLTYSGSGSRSESAWSGSSGGISAYEPLPAYQSGVSIAGGGTLRSRAVADVSFNADPNTGQYVVITPPGGSAGWNVYGGTSISSPQWAGMLAVVNATRVLNGQAVLGDAHGPLYTQIAEVPGNYAGAFDDITSGNDGSCATCQAAVGYDQSTGWGTPNFATLLPLLGAVQALPPLPGSTMPSGIQGVAYSTAWPATDSGHNPLTYTVTGAPSGLTVSSSGSVTWAHPLAGTYSFGVTVQNSAGKSATGTESLTIAPPPAAPTVPGASFVVKTGTALSRSLGVTAPANSGTLTYSLAGAPSGLTVSSAGVLTWANAVQGNYTVTATATNAYGASGSGVLNITVIPESAPVFSGTTTFNGVAGSNFSATISVSDPNGGTIALSASGGPSGLTLSSSGVLAWAQPVAGVYSVVVKATDSYGYTASATYKLNIEGTPVVTGGSLTGNTGAPVSAQIKATDPIGSTLTYAVSGAPAGVAINSSGLLTWANPVKGTYTFHVTVQNAAGFTATAAVTLTIYGQPVLNGGKLGGTTSDPVSATITATDPNGSALTYTVAGAPSGLTISSAGVLNWTSPVHGTYNLTVTAKDALGASASAVYTLVIYGLPSVSSPNLTGSSSSAFHATISATDPNSSALTLTLDGAPAGLTITNAGAITWANPVSGSYFFVVTATDALGFASSAAITLTIQ